MANRAANPTATTIHTIAGVLRMASSTFEKKVVTARAIYLSRQGSRQLANNQVAPAYVAIEPKKSERGFEEPVKAKYAVPYPR